MSSEHSIYTFDPYNASVDLIERYHDFDDIISFELAPEEGLTSREYRRRRLLIKNPYKDTFTWICIHKDNETELIIGKAILHIEKESSLNYKQNGHIARLEMSVLKEYRRKKIGSFLLKEVVKKAKEVKNVEILMVGTENSMGKAFCDTLGAKVALEQSYSLLDLNRIDWNVIKKWKELSIQLEKNSRVNYLEFEKAPEAIIEEYANLYTETINQQPLGSLQLRNIITPETLRNRAKLWVDDEKLKWHTIISIESDERISGLTEILYNPAQPDFVHQLLTGVKQEYRGKGLGKALKAKMLLFIQEKYPNIKFIGTSNTVTNNAMLKINTDMGFKEMSPLLYFEFNVDQLARKLNVQ